jgi:hypothetical protein
VAVFEGLKSATRGHPGYTSGLPIRSPKANGRTMVNYRRTWLPCATFFFTVVLCDTPPDGEQGTDPMLFTSWFLVSMSSAGSLVRFLCVVRVAWFVA